MKNMFRIFTGWIMLTSCAAFSGEIEITGCVKSCTAVPEVSRLDYPNCLYTAELEVYRMTGDESPIPDRVVLTIPIVLDKKMIAENKLAPGDKICVKAIRYDDAPQKIQEMQIADDLNLLEWENYYVPVVTRAMQLPVKKESSGKTFIRIDPVEVNSPDPRAAEMRCRRMAEEIKRCEMLLKEHGGSYLLWEKNYQSDRKAYLAECANKTSFWKNDCFFSYFSSPFYSRYPDQFIKIIVEYKKFLSARNIDLILLRIPNKGDFNEACLRFPDRFEPAPRWCEFYHTCLLNDIEIVDPLPHMWTRRYDFPLFYFNHIEREGHPFEGTSFCAAEVLAEVLARYLDAGQSKSKRFQFYDSAYSGTAPRGLWPAGNKKFPAGRNITFRGVRYANGKIPDFTKDTPSSFLVVSNSFGAYPNKRAGASVPHYAATLLNTDFAWFYQDGIGNSMLRNILQYPDIFKNKKCVIMIMHPGQWNECGPAFPKYRDVKVSTMLQLHKRCDAKDLLDLVQDDQRKNFHLNSDNHLVPLPVHDRLGGKINIPVPKNGNKILRFHFERHMYITLQALCRDVVVDECAKSVEQKKDYLDLNIPENVDEVTLLFRSIFPKDQPEITGFEIYTY